MRRKRRVGLGRVLTGLAALALSGAPLACAGGGGGASSQPPAPSGRAAAPAPAPDTTPTAPAAAPAPSAPQRAGTAVATRSPFGALLDTVHAGRFDNGRMWTFEYPPVKYLTDTYHFHPDSTWFRRARMSALRIEGCSASFVSPHGLVMTNHHCARESVVKVTRPGEDLVDNGFFAKNLADERKVDGFHADRLVEIRDVTDSVYAQLQGLSEDQKAQKRQSILDSLHDRILDEFGGEDGGYKVEMISLYNGGRYSAYIFRHYTDVRLVMSPELQIGYFGGDPDNFTYPRYNLDVSFFRVYGDDGKPLDTPVHFGWGAKEGASKGEPVFVIGNPGSTSRLQTVAELRFRRDVSDAGLLRFLRSRIAALKDFRSSHPDEAKKIDLQNTIFSLSNSEKAYTGMMRGLHDAVIMARRRDAQRSFEDSLAAHPDLQKQYGGLVDRMADLQDQKRQEAAAYGAFLALTSEDYASHALIRALWAQQIVQARSRGIPEQPLEGMKKRYLSVGSQPKALDEELMAARFREVVESYGKDSDVAKNLLQGRTPEGLAAVIAQRSALMDSTSAARALSGRTLTADDPAVAAVARYFGVFVRFQRMLSKVSPEEQEVSAELGRAHFEVYGTSVPPDATFSLRLADGVVKGYDYNGTEAPYHTTFYGLYNRYYSHHGNDDPSSPWALPKRWQHVPSGLDLSTPLDFVSTADIIGGNSGSPVVDRNLDVVGLIFDGNIESLPGDYIYMPGMMRAVAVDVRAIQAALDHVYDMDRLVLELTQGRLASTEQQADSILAAR